MMDRLVRLAPVLDALEGLTAGRVQEFRRAMGEHSAVMSRLEHAAPQIGPDRGTTGVARRPRSAGETGLMPSVRDFLGFVVNPPPGDPTLTAQSDLLPKGAVLIPAGIGAPSGSVPVADGTGGYSWRAGPPPAGAVTVPPGSGAAAGSVPTADGAGGYVAGSRALYATVPPGSGAAAGSVPTADGAGGYVWKPPIAPVTERTALGRPDPALGSWANLAGFETTAYLKDPLGFVHLKGVVHNGSTGTGVFALPAGFRPSATTARPLGSTGLANATVEIDASGNVVAFISVASAIGFSGLTFLAEN